MDFDNFLFQSDFRGEKVFFCLVVRGVYPPYPLSGPTTKKNRYDLSMGDKQISQKGLDPSTYILSLF